jgi:hypothetical protein
MIQTASSTEMRFCSDCGEEKPLAEFRRRSRSRDRRHSQCATCFAEYMRAYRASRRRQAIGQFARDVKNLEHSPKYVEKLCRIMARRFGGLDSLAKAWKTAIDAAAAARPGSRMVLNSLLAIVRLLEISWLQAKRNEKPPSLPVEYMSDEELERVVLDVIAKALED